MQKYRDFKDIRCGTGYKRYPNSPSIVRCHVGAILACCSNRQPHDPLSTNPATQVQVPLGLPAWEIPRRIHERRNWVASLGIHNYDGSVYFYEVLNALTLKVRTG